MVANISTWIRVKSIGWGINPKAANVALIAAETTNATTHDRTNATIQMTNALRGCAKRRPAATLSQPRRKLVMPATRT